MPRKQMPSQYDERLARALCSLEGLSVGDALGQHFLVGFLRGDLAKQELPPPPWYFTDDTYMALSIVSLLRQDGMIDQDHVAASFAQRYTQDPYRGYGSGMHALLRKIKEG